MARASGGGAVDVDGREVFAAGRGLYETKTRSPWLYV